MVGMRKGLDQGIANSCKAAYAAKKAALFLRNSLDESVCRVYAYLKVYEISGGLGKEFSTGNRSAEYVLGNWKINNILLTH
jgi:hypothetical protein